MLLFSQRTNSRVFILSFFSCICNNMSLTWLKSSRARFRAATQKQVRRWSRAWSLLSQNLSLVLAFYCSQHELCNHSHTWTFVLLQSLDFFFLSCVICSPVSVGNRQSGTFCNSLPRLQRPLSPFNDLTAHINTSFISFHLFASLSTEPPSPLAAECVPSRLPQRAEVRQRACHSPAYRGFKQWAACASCFRRTVDGCGGTWRSVTQHPD